MRIHIHTNAFERHVHAHTQTEAFTQTCIHTLTHIIQICTHTCTCMEILTFFNLNRHGTAQPFLGWKGSKCEASSNAWPVHTDVLCTRAGLWESRHPAQVGWVDACVYGWARV